MQSHSVNIDTLKLAMNGEGLYLGRTSRSTVYKEDGSEGSYENRVPLNYGLGVHRLHCRVMNNGTRFEVEGSIGAFFNQNLCTSSNLPVVVSEILKLSLPRLNKGPSSSDLRRWERGDITLKRIDLAGNFDLGSEAAVATALRQIKHQFAWSDMACKLHAGYARWAPNKGEDFSISFYAKGPEVAGRRSLKALPEHFQTLLREESSSILRVELQLKRELKKLRLDRVKQWDKDTALEVYSTFLGKLPFLKILPSSETSDVAPKLPHKLRLAWNLHARGVDLRGVYSARTLQRYRTAFKKLGYDLSIPTVEDMRPIPLKEYLTMDRLKLRPSWVSQLRRL